MNGLQTTQSSFGPRETMNRLRAEIEARGMQVFAHIDHAALATEAGLPLLPTEVIIFGNPRAGTPLMQARQTVGIDLPLKVLVWQDASGKTWLSYNEPEWIAHRHGLDAQADPAVGKMAAMLKALSEKATADTPAS